MDMPRCPVCEQSDEVWTIENFVAVNGNTCPMLGPEKMLKGDKSHLADILKNVVSSEPKKPWLLISDQIAGVLFGERYCVDALRIYNLNLYRWEIFQEIWNRSCICIRHNESTPIFIPGMEFVMDVVNFSEYMSNIMTGTI